MLRVLMASRGVVPIGAGAGGAELQTFQLAKELVARGHQVTFVADVDLEQVAIPAGLEVVPVGMNGVRGLVRKLPSGFIPWLFQHLAGNLAVVRRIRNLVRQSPAGFDVIHCHGALSALGAKLASPVPVVYTEHDATPWMCHYRRWWEQVVRRVIYRTVNVAAFRRVDRVVTNFESLAQELTERWCIPRERLISIRNGIDVDGLTNARGRLLSVSEELGIGSYCLFVGSLDLRKAPDILLRALSDAPGITCVLVGDGPARHHLEQLAQQLNVTERVRFAGYLRPSELGRYYAEADLLVLPSFSETTPRVILEAMACGTPVVASRVGGIPTIVEDWKTGFLVKPGDVGQLAMVLRFLTEDKPRLRRMGAEAQKRVQMWLWPSVLASYILLFQGISGAPSNPLISEARGPAEASGASVDLAGSV
jgi:glycosyltransferase involved in cell wall biosynthesis